MNATVTVARTRSCSALARKSSFVGRDIRRPNEKNPTSTGTAGEPHRRPSEIRSDHREQAARDDDGPSGEEVPTGRCQGADCYACFE
jgi:hypothetical protein